MKGISKSTIDARDGPSEIARLKRENEELRRIVGQFNRGSVSAADASKIIKTARETESLLSDTGLTFSQLTEILSSVIVYPFDKSALSDLKSFLEATRRINPNDPPASVRRAASLLEAAGKNVSSEQISALSPMLHDASKAEAFMKLIEDAKRVLPEEEDWKRLISLLEKGRATVKKGEHDWPPIINLSEANRQFFEKGKAELKPEFETHLRDVIVPLLLERVREYGVSTIEVIGHTDAQKIAPRNSNLDTFLLDIMRNSTVNMSSLIPADNGGLGLARATAVVRLLASDERLKGYTLLPLSGGQLIGVDDGLTSGDRGDEPERRRIEIRLRRANVSETPQAPRAITPAILRSPATIHTRPSQPAVPSSQPPRSTGSSGCTFLWFPC